MQFKGLSRVFPNTTVLNINSSVLSLLYGPTLISIHEYWKNHSFDYMDLCQPSDVSDFNTLSRFVIAFLNQASLISWQSPFAVIFSTSIGHEVMGLDAMFLVF